MLPTLKESRISGFPADPGGRFAAETRHSTEPVFESTKTGDLPTKWDFNGFNMV